MKNKAKIQNQRSSFDPNEIIDCPFQPGNLKISKKACLKRRQAARDDRSFLSIHNEFFLFTVKQGLLTCRNCPG
jgi:hypothetical protein